MSRPDDGERAGLLAGLLTAYGHGGSELAADFMRGTIEGRSAGEREELLGWMVGRLAWELVALAKDPSTEQIWTDIVGGLVGQSLGGDTPT